MKKLNNAERKRILDDGTAIDRAMRLAFRNVVLSHRQTGAPLVMCQGGQVVEVSPFEVPLPDCEP